MATPGFRGLLTFLSLVRWLALSPVTVQTATGRFGASRGSHDSVPPHDYETLPQRDDDRSPTTECLLCLCPFRPGQTVVKDCPTDWNEKHAMCYRCHDEAAAEGVHVAEEEVGQAVSSNRQQQATGADVLAGARPAGVFHTADAPIAREGAPAVPLWGEDVATSDAATNKSDAPHGGGFQQLRWQFLHREERNSIQRAHGSTNFETKTGALVLHCSSCAKRMALFQDVPVQVVAAVEDQGACARCSRRCDECCLEMCFRCGCAPETRQARKQRLVVERRRQAGREARRPVRGGERQGHDAPRTAAATGGAMLAAHRVAEVAPLQQTIHSYGGGGDVDRVTRTTTSSLPEELWGFAYRAVRASEIEAVLRAAEQKNGEKLVVYEPALSGGGLSSSEQGAAPREMVSRIWDVASFHRFLSDSVWRDLPQKEPRRTSLKKSTGLGKTESTTTLQTPLLQESYPDPWLFLEERVLLPPNTRAYVRMLERRAMCIVEPHAVNRYVRFSAECRGENESDLPSPLAKVLVRGRNVIRRVYHASPEDDSTTSTSSRQNNSILSRGGPLCSGPRAGAPTSSSASVTAHEIHTERDVQSDIQSAPGSSHGAVPWSKSVVLKDFSNGFDHDVILPAAFAYDERYLHILDPRDAKHFSKVRRMAGPRFHVIELCPPRHMVIFFAAVIGGTMAMVGGILWLSGWRPPGGSETPYLGEVDVADGAVCRELVAGPHREYEEWRDGMI